MKKILLAAIVSFVVCSCADYEKLVFKSAEFGNVGDFALVNNSVQMHVDLNLSIDNPTCSRFKMSDFCITVFTAQKKKFAELTLDGEDAVLPRHCSDTVAVGVKVVIMNPMSILTMKSLDQAFDAMKSKNMTADCFIRVKQGMFGKKIEYKDVPFDRLVNEIKKLNK